MSDSMSVYVRPYWSSFDPDGTLTIGASLWDEHGHSSAVTKFPPDHAEYGFWCWLVEQRRYHRPLERSAVEDARREYGRVGA